MNQTAMEFVWRRLEEPPELFGRALAFEPRWWVGIGVLSLLLALVLIVRVCLRESKTVGRGWAALLGVLRALVCLLLLFIWFLPAMRQVETSTQPSHVLALFDVSASMQTSDERPTDEPDQLRPTRQDRVLDLLLPATPAATPAATPTATPTATPGATGANPAAGSAAAAPRDLIGKLLERNPLICGRFGEMLDPETWTVTAGHRPSRSHWTRRLQPSVRPTLDELVQDELVQALVKTARLLKPEYALDDPRHHDLVESLERRLADQKQTAERLLNRTNLGAALRDALRKEANANLQGVILFSDGHATAGSEQELNDALALARREKIPIFAVGVGRREPTPNLRLVDVLAPQRIQPEDEFPVRVALEGVNLAANQEVAVVLRVDKPDGTFQELRHSVTLPAAPAGASRGAAEFRLANPEKLKGNWRLTARALPLKGELSRADNTLAEPAVVTVEDRKLAVLLISSGPLHDYQFLRALLAREPEKFDVTLWLQSAQPGTVQDVDARRLLDRFPTELRDRDADPMNLGNYDVIVAFDPDWRLVPWQAVGEKPSPQANLRAWVEQLGGGLVVVAGPVHGFSLARDPNLQIIRYLYPVLLDDTAGSILQIDRQAKLPHALNWDPSTAGAPFLDLLDSGNPANYLDGWEFYFDVERNPTNGLAEGPAGRGFYTFFPLHDAKPGAAVLARFGDPDPRVMTPGGQRQPYFVLSKVGKGPVFYIGSPETYLLREFSEKFHERFWTKLLRHMGKRESSRGLLIVGNRYVEGETVTVEVELLDAALKPLSRVDYVADMRLEVWPAQAQPGAKAQAVWDEGLRSAVRAWLRARDPAAAGRELPPEEMQAAVAAFRATPQFKNEAAIVGTAGRFVFHFPAGQAGRYRLELPAPGSSAKLGGRFEVVASDPERDDASPRLAYLHRLASPARDVQLLESAKRPAFLAALAQSRRAMEEEHDLAARDAAGTLNRDAQRSADPRSADPRSADPRSADPRSADPRSADLAAGREPGEEKLYFTLETAPWIAECIDANPIAYRTEGKTSDLWDKGWTVLNHLDNPDAATGPPWALMVLVLLLGTEWLTRKLLRLA